MKIKRVKKEKRVRTWEDFVEESVDHRTVKQICAIAQATRWGAFLPEIKVYAKNLRKFFKKSKNK